MPEYDRTMKRLTSVFTRDYVRFVLDVEPEAAEALTVEEQDKELPALSREVDFLARVRLGARQSLLLVEFQTRWAADMPQRMAGYCWRLHDRYQEPVWPVVVVLQPGGQLRAEWSMSALGKVVAFCRFDVLPLWEADAAQVIRQKLVGLYPLLPLMRWDEPEPRAVLERSQQLVLDEIQDREQRADAYVALRVLGGIAYPVDLVTDILRRSEMMLESPVYRQIKEEGREEGLRTSILAVLTARFGPLPGGVIDRINGVTDVATLEELVRRAAMAESWDALELL